jgi:hypothetical protein
MALQDSDDGLLGTTSRGRSRMMRVMLRRSRPERHRFEGMIMVEGDRNLLVRQYRTDLGYMAHHQSLMLLAANATVYAHQATATWEKIEENQGASLHYGDSIVVKDCRHVLGGEFVGGVAD